MTGKGKDGGKVYTDTIRKMTRDPKIVKAADEVDADRAKQAQTAKGKRS